MTADFTYLLRSIRRSPAHAAAIILTLAIGIGATTAIVSVVDYVLLRHLPFAESGRLVMMFEQDGRGGFRVPSNPTAVDWSNDPSTSTAFEGITYVRGDGARVCLADHCESKASAFVKADFFPLLRPRLSMGRLLLPDDQHAASQAVVISHRLWQSLMGGDPKAIGRRILVDSVPNVVVGVLAPGAVYPPFADIWQPLSVYHSPDVLQKRGSHVDSRTLGRLKPGVDSAAAARVMSVVGARLGAMYPEDQRSWKAGTIDLHTELLGNVQPMLLAFAGAAALILILVCANVAGLLVTRGIARRRELAIRLALGASPARIVRQLVVEAIGYAIIGATIGSLLAIGGVALAKRFLVAQLPALSELAIDARLLLIAF